MNTAPIISPEVGSFVAGSTLSTVAYPITVTWGYVTGDTYAVNVYMAPTDSCLGPVGPGWTLIGTGGYTVNLHSFTVPSFTAPSTNMYLCAQVIDDGVSLSNNYPIGLWSGPASYVVVAPMSSYINNDESAVTIDLGQAITLTAYVSGGSAPYTYQWYGTDTPSPGTCPTATTVSGPLSTDPGYNTASMTVAPAATTTYAVLVTDSSITPTVSCEQVTVTVSPALTGSLAIDGVTSGTINTQVGSPTFQAIVSWTGGTGPWYNVVVTTGTDSYCSGDTKTVASASDVTGNETILAFPEPTTPSQTTYYCATITDSSMGFEQTTGTSTLTGYPVVVGPIQVNTSPALSAPTLVIAPTTIDFGMPPTTITATVAWAGGTAPYYVSLWTGSSSSCASDVASPLFPPGSTPPAITGGTDIGQFVYPPSDLTFLTSGYTMSFAFPSPASTTYYCAIVIDSSGPTFAQASVTYTPAGSEFLVEGLFAVMPPTLSSYATEVQTPQYEGVPVTATVTWSGGTGPYDVTLYNDTSLHNTGNGLLNYPSGTCLATDPVLAVTPGSNPVTGVTGAGPTYMTTFTFLSPNEPGVYAYCAIVTDVNGNVVYSGPSLFLTVAGYLSITSFNLYSTGPPLGTPGTDNGQTESATAVVVWTGGSAPYAVTLYSGSSSLSCALDTTVVASASGIYALTTKLTFTSPGTTTFYCATITDSSAPVSKTTAGPDPWTDSLPPSVYITTTSGGAPVLGNTEEVPAGTGTTLYPYIVTPGTSPNFLQWFIGAGCVTGSAVTGVLGPFALGTLPSPAGSEYPTGVITTTTTYSVLLTDSSSGTPAASSCADFTVTTDSGPTGLYAVSTGPFAGTVYVGSEGGLNVIDTDSNSLVNTIPVPFAGMIAVGVTVAQGTGYNWIYALWQNPTTGSGAMCIYYMASDTELGCVLIAAGSYPSAIAMNNAQYRAFVTLTGTNQVQEYDGFGVVNTYNVGPGPLNLAVDPTTNTVYVTDNGGNTVSVLQELSVNDYAVTTVTTGFQPFGVAINPANDEVYVTNSGSGTVSVLSGSSYQVLATIKTGGAPAGIAIDTVSNTAYVADMQNNVVIPINLATNTPSATTIPVGNQPYDVAFFLSPIVNPATPSLVYVTNAGSNFVSVINPATGTVVATIVVPS